jgi:sec-independent protein translocase protein TatC
LPILPHLRKKDPKQEMGFVDHLEALRWHVVRALIAIMIVAILIFLNIDWVFDRIIFGPMREDFISYTGLCRFSHYMHFGDALCMPPPSVKMQVTSFGSQFMSSISISFIGGFIISFPYVCWEIWRFIKPALSPVEIRQTRGSVWFVTFFFLLGIAFGYFLLAPFTFSFLSNYKLGVMGALETKPTLDDYMENMIDIIIGAGLAFQLPVVSFVLTKMGLIGPLFLTTYRKYAYLFILVIAAIITPSPDWMSQAIVSAPLFLLYELSIFISAYVERKRKKSEEEFFRQ